MAAASRARLRIALDDFGTGYGGFTYLKRLRINYLKIDIEFVRDIDINPASRQVVEAVVGLARGFGLKTVAEGVEDAETLGSARRPRRRPRPGLRDRPADAHVVRAASESGPSAGLKATA